MSNTDLFASVQNHLHASRSERDLPPLRNSDYYALSPYNSNMIAPTLSSDSITSDKQGQLSTAPAHGPRPLEPTSIGSGYGSENLIQYPPGSHWGATSSGVDLPLTAMGDYDVDHKLADDAYLHRYDDVHELPRAMWGKYSWNNREILERKIQNRHQGRGRQRWPVFSWVLACVYH